MSQLRIFETLDNGKVIVQLYNPNTDLEGVLHVIREGYMKHANSFIAFGMNKPGASKARLEYEKLIHAVLSFGISIVARHVPTNRIIGCCLNSLQSRPGSGQATLYEEIRDQCESQLVRNLLNFRISKDKQINIFETYNIKHYFEMAYVVILSEYRVKNIGYELAKCSVALAREMAKAKYPETLNEAQREKIPEIIFVSSSSKYLTRILEKLGFNKAKVFPVFPYNQLKVNGVYMSEKIPSEHTEATLNVLKL